MAQEILCAAASLLHDQRRDGGRRSAGAVRRGALQGILVNFNDGEDVGDIYFGTPFIFYPNFYPKILSNTKYLPFQGVGEIEAWRAQ